MKALLLSPIIHSDSFPNDLYLNDINNLTSSELLRTNLFLTPY